MGSEMVSEALTSFQRGALGLLKGLEVGCLGGISQELRGRVNRAPGEFVSIQIKQPGERSSVNNRPIWHFPLWILRGKLGATGFLGHPGSRGAVFISAGICGQ